MSWSWDKLQRQLAREAREYLADLRNIKESLQYAEGWVALLLIVGCVAMLCVWGVVSLGFSPPNDHVSDILTSLGMRFCRPLENVAGVIIIIDVLLTIFLAAITLGNVFSMMIRAQRGLPRNPRDMIVSALLLMAVGIGGILFMLAIC